jgi:4-amino-4-deoxy-L-arabinose transferase-like glycosyltransferase
MQPEDKVHNDSAHAQAADVVRQDEQAAVVAAPAPTIPPRPAMPPPAPGRLRAQLPFLLLIAIAWLIFAITGMRKQSATYDEVAHLPAGYTYWAFDDYRLNMEHPPLVKLLAGWPLQRLGTKADPDVSFKTADTYYFGEKLLYEWNDGDRLLFWGRLPLVLLTLCFGLAVFFCAREFYGLRAGYVALLLFLFLPEVLAHGQLVTTDVSVAGFFFVATYAFYRALWHSSWAAFLLACLAAGCAVIAKFSGVLVFGAMALVGLLAVFSAEPLVLPRLRRQISSHWGKLLTVLAALVVMALISWALIWASYGWRYSIAPTPISAEALNWSQYWMRPSFSIDVMRFAREHQLLPEAFIYGFLRAATSLEGRNAFLMGEYSTTGWWYYFPVTFLIKTTIPLLLLIVLGFVFWRRYRTRLAGELMLLLPVALYLVFALTSNFNIGNRHLLPIYPFLIVFATKMGRALEAGQPRALALICAALLGWHVIEAAIVYPHHLAYFNQIAGGPAGGYKWLVDSNLDWGQDLKGLAAYQRANQGEPLYLSYFGTAKPEYYGIQAKYLPSFNPGNKRREIVSFNDVPRGALVAVSATSLQGLNFTEQTAPGWRAFMARLQRSAPLATIGHSIFIYRAP